MQDSTDGASRWFPVPVARGPAPRTVSVGLAGLPAGSAPTAVRYAWGDAAGAPNGDDDSCCEGDGVDQPCMPVQCPLLALDAAAPFGGLPIDPFIAEIAGGKCVCPEPQACAA